MYSQQLNFSNLTPDRLILLCGEFNKNLKELELPKGIRIGSIVRDKNIIIPNSQTIFKENDDVVFFAETNCIKKLEKLLSKV